MPKLADNPQSEQAKKQLEENKKLSDRSRAEFTERSQGRPTPTQEENDLAALGAHIIEHDDDGSGPDLHNKAFSETGTKHVEAAPTARPQSYQTRQQTPKAE